MIGTWVVGSMLSAVVVSVFRWLIVDVTTPRGSSCFLNPAKKGKETSYKKVSAAINTVPYLFIF